MGVLIIGSGNGGLALGSMLILKGKKVNLYDKFEEVIDPIRKNNNKITVNHLGKKRKVQFHVVTNHLEEGLQEVKYIFIIVPAFAHKSIATELANVVKNDQIIILHPGRTGGALEFKRIFALKEKENVIAETDTLLFACRKNNVHGTEINIYGVKKRVGVAASPKENSQEVTNLLNNLLPRFENYETVLSTSLSNIGAIFHPVPFLFNLVRTERKESYKYYHDGITQSICNILEGVDRERLAIAKAFGLTVPSALEWLNYNYNLNEKTLYDAIQKNTRYSEIDAPTEMKARYIMEDVPMGLVPMAALGKLAEVPTPIIDSIITLASEIYDYDFRERGRTIHKADIISYIGTNNVAIY